MTHTTKDGEQMSITEMSNRHLLNTIHAKKRKSVEGVKQVDIYYDYDDDSFSSNTYVSDPKLIYGNKALEILNFQVYINEAMSRFILGTMTLVEIQSIATLRLPKLQELNNKKEVM